MSSVLIIINSALASFPPSTGGPTLSTPNESTPITSPLAVVLSVAVSMAALISVLCSTTGCSM